MLSEKWQPLRLNLNVLINHDPEFDFGWQSL